MIRKITCMLMTIVVILSLCSFTPDTPETPIDDLDYSYTILCRSSLYITGSTGKCASYLLGYSGVTDKIVVKQYLQVRDGNRWRTSQFWSNTYYSYSAYFTNERTLYSGNTYRVYTEFTVYSGSNSETVTAYSASNSV